MDGRRAGQRFRRSGVARPPRAVAVLITLTLLPAVLLSGSTPVAPKASQRMAPAGEVDWNAAVHYRPDPRTLAVGVTHAQHSVDEWGDVAARARARAILSATASYQNQHLFGWGTLNPEPSLGRYDWSSLDRRMELIRSSGGTQCARDRTGRRGFHRTRPAVPLPGNVEAARECVGQIVRCARGTHPRSIRLHLRTTRCAARELARRGRRESP